jgi:hypothetical protein
MPTRSSTFDLLTTLAPFVLFGVACSRMERTEAWEIGVPVATLDIVSDAGVVEVVAGETIRVEWTSRASEAEVSWHEESPGHVVVESRCTALLPCAVDLRLTVPSFVATRVALDHGEVWASGLLQVAVELDQGSVDIESAGRATAEVGSGSIRASLTDRANVRLVVAVGDVDVALVGGSWALDVEARDRSLPDVPVGADPSGHLKIVAPSGRATVERVATES